MRNTQLVKFKPTDKKCVKLRYQDYFSQNNACLILVLKTMIIVLFQEWLTTGQH